MLLEAYGVFIERIQGNLMPHLQPGQPKPHKQPHTNVWKEVVEVVAAAAVVAAAPYLTEFAILPLIGSSALITQLPLLGPPAILAKGIGNTVYLLSKKNDQDVNSNVIRFCYL